MFREFFRTIWMALAQLITQIGIWLFPPRPRVSGFEPSGGWGGTTIVIRGAHFDPERDGNQVSVGGQRALVIEAAAERLRVVAHRDTTTGPVEVTVGGRIGSSAREFTVLSHPDQGDITQAGPPRCFTGPQPGTPRPRGLGQRILGILVYPADQDPGTPAERAAKRDEQISQFDRTDRFYREASYGATSFDFEVTEWLGLPEDRDFYFWQADDIVRARRALYRQTRLGIAVSDSSVFLAHRAAGLAVIDATDPERLSLEGSHRFLLPATAVRLTAGRAYVGLGSGHPTEAGTGAVEILDVTDRQAPAPVGAVAVPGWVTDLDLSGDLAIVYVAAERQGLLLVDATSLDLIGSVSRNELAGWAMGVRVSEGHAYVAAGEAGLVIVRNPGFFPANPTVVGHLAFGNHWALAVAVSGTTAYVATDGDGVQIVDVTDPEAPVLLGTERTALRPAGLAASGTQLYVAGADQGLVILDVSDPRAPVELGHLDVAPAFNVTVAGTTAFVATGGGTVRVVDVGDPAAPRSQDSYNAAPDVNVDLASWRSQLDAAVDGEDLGQRLDAFLAHSFRAAQDAGFDLTQFEGYVICQHGPFLRGQSWSDTGIQRFGDIDISFGGTKGIIYLAHEATWSRRAHEIGHWLGLADIYQESDADGNLTLGTAGAWDVMGATDRGALFSGYNLHDKLGYYTAVAEPPDDPRNKVATRAWTLGAEPVDESFEIVAHGLTEDPPGTGRVHLLRLQVAEGLLYFVEVRQRPSLLGNPVIFDAAIPVQIDAAHPWQGGVIVTKVLDHNTHANMRERTITLLDDRVLDEGDEVVDAARRLRISVEERTSDWPLTYRVRLEWNQPVGDDPEGRFDLHITPWNTDHWETVDIWVDSRRNNPADTAVFEFHQRDPDDETIPRRNGDRPWVGHANTIFARVRNAGMDPAENVFVSFYTNSPPGIGDNGSWVPRETRRVEMLAAEGNAVVSTTWIPREDEHTCLKVEIAAQIGEVSVGNNVAQENVFAFDSAASSSHQPVEFSAAVRNPYPRWRLVHLQVRGLPAGWSAVIDHGWVWVPPRGEKPLRVVIWTVRGTPDAGTAQLVPPVAEVRVEGWTTQMHRMLPIGGLLVIIKANQKVEVDWEVVASPAGGPLVVSGCLRPPLADVPITVEVTDPGGNVRLLHTQTDGQGCFRTDRVRRRAPYVPQSDGDYQIQIFVTAGGEAAETESERRSFPVRR